MLLPPDLAAALAHYNRINHYGRANGMVLFVATPGQAEYRMVVRDEHLSSPGTMHGGALAGLMDAALGAAALSLAFTTAELVSTVEFKLNYLRPVLLGDHLRAVAQVTHVGTSLLVSSATIFRRPAEAPAAEEQAVAQGLGTFNRYPAAKRAL